MRSPGRAIAIPIVEHGSNRVVGGFCSTTDVVSALELQALARLKALRTEANQVKLCIKEAVDPKDRAHFVQRLQVLRQEASVWRAKREQATREKHVALGHLPSPIRTPYP